MEGKSIKGIQWLVLGGGAVVTEYYLPAMEALGILSNVTIIEQSKQNADNINSRYQVDIKVGSYIDFLNEITSEEYQYCIITLPNKFHIEAIEKIAQKGIHILCEKPLSTKKSEVDLAQLYKDKYNVHVSVAMTRRLMPSFTAFKKVINNNQYGEIKQIIIEDGNPFAWVADSYSFFDPMNGGVLADMGVHYIDLLLDIFNNTQYVRYTDDYHGGVEANCELELLVDNEIPCKLKFSRTHSLLNKFVVQYENASVELVKDQYDYCIINESGLNHKVSVENAFTSGQWPRIYESCFIEQLYLFHDSVINNTNYMEISSVITTTEYISKAYDSRIISLDSLNSDSYAITGATGFIGSALINRLAQKSNDITAIVRSYKNCAEIAKYKIKIPRISLSDYEAVKSVLTGKKHLVHLAYANDNVNARQVNVEETKLVVKAAVDAGVESIVILSSMYVYGQGEESKEITEESKKIPYAGIYAETKAEMEKWCLDFAKKNNQTRISILNPSCVYGPLGKTYTTLPLELAKNNRFAWINNGEGIANVVYIDNLLDAIELTLKNKLAHAESFIINDGTHTWKEFLNPFFKNTQLNPVSISMHELNSDRIENPIKIKDVLRFLISNYELMELVNRNKFLHSIKNFIFKSLPSFKKQLNDERLVDQKKIVFSETRKPIIPKWVGTLYGPNKYVFLSTKAQKVLGWEPRISFDESIKITNQWLEDTNRK